MNHHVIGVNGCRGGWLVCRIEVATSTVDLITVVPRIRDVIERELSAGRIAIDIPIGLPALGRARKVDGEARKLLTNVRGSSVFPAPPREVLRDFAYPEANAHSRALSGKGISKQTHAIFPKIAEVDEFMTPRMQDRIFEVHPELSFRGLARQPMPHAKRTPQGYEERRQILSAMLSSDIPHRSEISRFRLPIEPDDLLDALVAGTSALRVYRGEAGRIPALPEIDVRGLRMEMLF